MNTENPVDNVPLEWDLVPKDASPETGATSPEVMKSDFDEFKENVSRGAEHVVDRAGSLFSRAGGALKDAAWLGLYAVDKVTDEIGHKAERAVEFTAGMPQRVERAADRVGEVISDAKDGAIEFGRDVASGARETGKFVIGAGILAGEALANKTAELGERGIAAGKEFVASGVAKAEAAKEKAHSIFSRAKTGTTNAVHAAKTAVIEKTTQKINEGKEALQSGVTFVAEAGIAVKDKAKEGIKSVWEKGKEKLIAIKRARLMSELARYEREHQQISEKASELLSRANNVRAAIAAL